MYKNLSPTALGISGRQSELIELALTYGFRGIDLDMDDMAKRAKLRGIEHAGRFVQSAKIKVGSFELPPQWRGAEADFRNELNRLGDLADVAATLGARRCVVSIMPGTDDAPYHEYFETHRKRLAEIAEVFAKRDIRLGLGLLAAPAHRQNKRFEFIHQVEALLLLIKSVAHSHVGLLFDSWNWQLGGGTLDQLRSLKADQIVSVRLADLPADADRGTITEEQRHLPMENGAVDVVAALTTLRDMKYTGPVSMYPHPRRMAGMTRDAIVQRCAAALEEPWNTVGLTKSAKLAPAVAEP